MVLLSYAVAMTGLDHRLMCMLQKVQNNLDRENCSCFKRLKYILFLRKKRIINVVFNFHTNI